MSTQHASLAALLVLGTLWPSLGAAQATEVPATAPAAAPATLEQEPTPPPGYGQPATTPPSYGQPATPTTAQGATPTPVYGPRSSGTVGARDRYPAGIYQPTRGRAIIGYRTEMRNPPELWGTGLGLFLAGWVLDFAALTPIGNAMSRDRSEANKQDAQAWALVPIVGPLVQLGIEAPHPAIPILTGIMQIGGLVLFALGLTTQQAHRAAIYQGSPEDPSMLTVELDGGATSDGAYLGLTVRHL